MNKRTILSAVSVVLPIVGAILWLINRKKNVADGKLYGKATLYGLIVMVGNWLLTTLIGALSNGYNGWITVVNIATLALMVYFVVKIVKQSKLTADAPVDAPAADAAMQQPAASEQPANGKKTFFLKRWLVGLSDAVDHWLFKEVPGNNPTVGKTFWIITIIGFVAGAITAAVTTFSKDPSTGKIGTLEIVIVAAIFLIPMVMYAIPSIRQFDTVKTRILRGVFIFFWCLFGGALGFGLGVIVVIVVLLILALWLILKMFGAAIFGETGGGSKRSWRLDNGTKVTEETDLLGGKTYSGDDGRSYERTSDNTFREN